MRLIARLALVFALTFSLTPAQADPWPDDPYGFCMPDLDGHCRYCELRFDQRVPTIRCVG